MERGKAGKSTERPAAPFARPFDVVAAGLPVQGPRQPDLVEPRDDGVSTVPIGPVVLVSPDRIIGRAWAQFYPVWDRRML